MATNLKFDQWYDATYVKSRYTKHVIEIVDNDNHNKNRAKVCIIFYNKGIRGLFIKGNIITGYSVDNLDFLWGLYDICHLLLASEISEKSVKLPAQDSSDPKQP